MIERLLKLSVLWAIVVCSSLGITLVLAQSTDVWAAHESRITSLEKANDFTGQDVLVLCAVSTVGMSVLIAGAGFIASAKVSKQLNGRIDGSMVKIHDDITRLEERIDKTLGSLATKSRESSPSYQVGPG